MQLILTKGLLRQDNTYTPSFVLLHSFSYVINLMYEKSACYRLSNLPVEATLHFVAQ